MAGGDRPSSPGGRDRGDGANIVYKPSTDFQLVIYGSDPGSVPRYQRKEALLRLLLSQLFPHIVVSLLLAQGFHMNDSWNDENWDSAFRMPALMWCQAETQNQLWADQHWPPKTNETSVFVWLGQYETHSAVTFDPLCWIIHWKLHPHSNLSLSQENILVFTSNSYFSSDSVGFCASCKSDEEIFSQEKRWSKVKIMSADITSEG